ncbi:MAG TPA: NUDIX domain-containing protein [Anaerolineaceae bacterium]|nr:NUDIX domain-containing protein [Anaerolineaceae bacterium]
MGKAEQGVTTDRYTMVPRTLVFLTRGDRVLLLKGASTKRIWPNRYNGVGGHIERGENVIASARREVLEETGLKPDDLWLTGVIAIDSGSQTGIMVFVFRGTSHHGETKASNEGQLEWIRLTDLPNLDLVEDVPQLLERVMTKEKGNVPFFARYSYNAADQLVMQFE